MFVTILLKSLILKHQSIMDSNKKRLILFSVLLMLSFTSFGQNVRGFYLQDVGDWLGNTSKENEILSYAQGNGFNYILFYSLGDINWNSSTEKNQLGAFIKKGRTQYGISQFGAPDNPYAGLACWEAYLRCAHGSVPA